MAWMRNPTSTQSLRDFEAWKDLCQVEFIFTLEWSRPLSCTTSTTPLTENYVDFRINIGVEIHV